MPFGLTEAEIVQIRTVFLSFPLIESVILFGSRALGTYKNGSDIDLALKGNIPPEHIARIRGILNDELQLPYIFDVVDYSMINPALKAHIDEFGQEFYWK